MKSLILFLIAVVFFSINFNLAANAPATFENILSEAEQNPAHFHEARRLAIAQNLPLSIYLPGEAFMYVISSQQDQVFYAFIKDPANPVESGEIISFDIIKKRYNLGRALLYYGNGRYINYDPVFRQNPASSGDSLLLIPDWASDRVLAFDPFTGDLLDAYYIPVSSTYLASPKEAVSTPRQTISISDQLNDLVLEFDTSGAYAGILAPAGGLNKDIIDNPRGHTWGPNGNLLVTVASGANQESIAEFDPAGNYVGNFIANGAGGLNGPFDILFRRNDVLVSADGSDAIHRYDLNGNFLGNLTAITNFPQQITELADGSIAVANWSGQSGVLVYSATGILQRVLSGITGNRGVYELGNGNILTTNNSGVHELNPVSGSLIRTVAGGVNAQFISLATFAEPASADVILSARIGGESQYRNFWVNGSWDSTGHYDPLWSGPMVALNDSGAYPDAVAGDQIFSGAVNLAIDSINTYNWWTGSENDMNSFLDDGSAFTVTSANTVYPDTLLLDGDGGINEWVIALPGDFNGWNNADDMARNGTVWSKEMQLAAGVYEYKFAVMHQWSAAYGDGGIGGGAGNFSFTAPDSGIYRFDFDDADNSHSVTPLVNIGAGGRQAAAGFELFSNFPNPFNPVTTINYNIPETTPVQLTVYSVSGEKIRSLVSGTQSAGGHSVVWDGKNDQGRPVGSGIYLYRLQAASQVLSKKMMLLK
ncbi:MAG: FlgD immunoglobulin-like domain containing protein [Calditrichia bacterium]